MIYSTSNCFHLWKNLDIFNILQTLHAVLHSHSRLIVQWRHRLFCRIFKDLEIGIKRIVELLLKLIIINYFIFAWMGREYETNTVSQIWRRKNFIKSIPEVCKKNYSRGKKTLRSLLICRQRLSCFEHFYSHDECVCQGLIKKGLSYKYLENSCCTSMSWKFWNSTKFTIWCRHIL